MDHLNELGVGGGGGGGAGRAGGRRGLVRSVKDPGQSLLWPCHQRLPQVRPTGITSPYFYVISLYLSKRTSILKLLLYVFCQMLNARVRI